MNEYMLEKVAFDIRHMQTMKETTYHIDIVFGFFILLSDVSEFGLL